MNPIFLSLGMLLSHPNSNVAADTIILNAGDNSKVIFYGKSADDLKKLEMLDLNKIIKDLNQKQNDSDPAQNQHVKLDEKGFVNPSMQEPTLNWKQRYLQNTFLNLHIGKGVDVNRYVFFKPGPPLLSHPTAQLTSEIVLQNKLTTNLSVVHDERLWDRPKAAISLRYGLGVGFNIQRYLHWNLVQDVPASDVKEVSTRAYELLTKEGIVPFQSDFNAFQGFLHFAPRISLKDSKGRSTFYASAGVRLNYNKIFENVIPAQYASSMSVNSTRGGTISNHGPIIGGGGYGVYSKNNSFGVSYLAEIGYKWIGVFVNYDPGYVTLNTKRYASQDRPTSGFSQFKTDKIGYISFGVKLGR